MIRTNFITLTAVLGLAVASLPASAQQHETGQSEATAAEEAPGNPETNRQGMEMMHGDMKGHAMANDEGGCGKTMGGGMMPMMRKMHGGAGKGDTGAPSVVINIYPGGGMDMGGMGMQRGMMDDDRGMGPMRRGGREMGGGMTGGDGMMMHRGRGRDLDLSEGDVREMMNEHFAMMGRDDLELGTVTPIDDDLMNVEVATTEGREHHRMVVNRHTGAMMRAD